MVPIIYPAFNRAFHGLRALGERRVEQRARLDVLVKASRGTRLQRISRGRGEGMRWLEAREAAVGWVFPASCNVRSPVEPPREEELAGTPQSDLRAREA